MRNKEKCKCLIIHQENLDQLMHDLLGSGNLIFFLICGGGHFLELIKLLLFCKAPMHFDIFCYFMNLLNIPMHKWRVNLIELLFLFITLGVLKWRLIIKDASELIYKEPLHIVWPWDFWRMRRVANFILFIYVKRPWRRDFRDFVVLY